MKNRFAKNLGILGITGLLIKLIGAFYRVPLAVFMSESAVAYYSLAYPWYNVLIVISSAALPAVIAKLVAEARAVSDLQGEKEVFAVAKRLLTSFGVISAVFLIGFAGLISRSLGYPESVYAFYMLGVASYFVALNESYRGFFQGVQRLDIFGYAQLIEQIGRVVFGLTLVIMLAKINASDGFLAGAGTSGAAIGSMMSWLFISSRFRKDYDMKGYKIVDFKGMSRKILKLVLPIALGASIMPLLSMIDGTLVVWRLRTVVSTAEAAILYSYVSFYSAPIINISQVFFTALQVSLLPTIAKHHVEKSSRLNEQVHFGVLLSVVVGLPMALGIWGFSEQILLFLYPSKAEIVPGAAPVLGILGLAIAFLAVYLATTSILQGLNAYKRPVAHLGIGAVVKIVSAYILIGVPTLHVKGAAISTLLAYAVAALLNLILLYRMRPPKLQDLKKLLGALIANALMIVTALTVYQMLSQKLGMRSDLLISIMAAVVVYFAAIILMRVVTKKDFEKMESEREVR
jgi:stage V sporulation protein B